MKLTGLHIQDRAEQIRDSAEPLLVAGPRIQSIPFVSTINLHKIMSLLLFIGPVLHLHPWDVHFISINTQVQEATSKALSPCHNGTSHPGTWL